jgi:DNA replication and repair protein RecF
MGATPAAVGLTALRLSNFRNYGSLALDLDPGPVVLTGSNGAGKTNLLEAVSFLSPGRGLRRAAFEEIVKDRAQGGFAIHAELTGPDGQVEIGTGTFGAAPGESGRKVRINGAPARTTEDLLDWLRVVWLVPAMDQLFTGPAADRRRFVDRLVLAIDPGHARRTLDYEKAMRGRNRLLGEPYRDEGWLTAIEAQMAEAGSAIAAARLELVTALAAIGEGLPDGGAFPKADIALVGAPGAILSEGSATEFEEGLAAALRAGRDRDAAAGRTLDGPHRADLAVRHRGKNMEAASCSTGEQKALLVGLMLAHARLCAGLAEQVPIVLLDEIAAHLDPHRRAALFAILEELGCQTFMTGTEASLFSALAGRAQFLTVEAGKVSPTASP